jgi:hypothetical protein
MTTHLVERDERTVSVENASYRWAYFLLSFGVLASVAYRGLALGQSSWDLLALVVLGGVVQLAYQASQRVVSRRSGVLVIAAVLVAAVAAALLQLLR